MKENYVSDTVIKTSFHDFHVEAGAKMVDFAGYRMPIQYKGITAEHLAVRENVGLFDLSHMGEFKIAGNESSAFLKKVTTNDVDALKIGDIQYSCMTYPDGGIVDDLLIYRMEDHYLLIVNAANIDKDFKWLESHLFDGVSLTDLSPTLSLLAIQGPNAQKVMTKLTDYDLDSMAYYTSAKSKIGPVEIMFSRTGYTGEDGFELYIPNEQADIIWKAVTEAGQAFGMELIGLAARDSLRLEMKMALYGNDIDETTTPIEAGLSWIVKLKNNFIGRDVLRNQKEAKPKRRLVCLELEGKVFPRKGYEIFDGDSQIGKVTSGTFSPSLQKPIALGYVPRIKAKSGSTVEIEIRKKRFPATVVKPPFYKGASHK